MPQRVEVTRRHHPLFGRELEVIHANKVMLTIRLANGSTMKMPRAWTNAGGATGVVEPSRCSLFTIEGVRELIDLVSALHPESAEALASRRCASTSWIPTNRL